MKIHKFITPVEITGDEVVVRDPSVVRQMQQVLHLEAGEECVIGDGAGMDAHVVIGEYEEGVMRGTLVGRAKNEKEPACAVVLACAILKGDNFDLVVQKATELGVRKIVPLVTSRTIKKDVNMSRLLAIVREAAEQADRGVVPEIATPMSFTAFLKSAAAPVVMLAAEGAMTPSVQGGSAVTLCVGPEGGWTEEEVALAVERGVMLRSLGKLTLRGETAAIVGSAFACAGWI